MSSLLYFTLSYGEAFVFYQVCSVTFFTSHTVKILHSVKFSVSKSIMYVISYFHFLPAMPLCHCIQIDSGAHPASIQWVSGAVTPGVKWSRHEAGYAPPSTAKVKNVWSYTSNVSVAWCLVKHRDNFTFTFASIEIL